MDTGELKDSFKKLFNVDFLSKKDERVVGVDIGSSSIKVVQLARKGGKAVLETYGELALGPYAGLEVGQVTSLPKEKLSEALRDVLREASVTTKTAAVSIPFASSLVSFVQMPPLPAKNLDQAIPLEARKYIPVPIAEVALDWFIVPEGDTPYAPSDDDKTLSRGGAMNVLLVAIHNEVLKVYQELARGAGLNVSFFEIEIFSTIRAALGHTSLAPIAIIDMGASSTKLYIVEYGIVRTSHLINRGGYDMTLALSKTLGMSVVKAESEKRAKGLIGLKNQPDAEDAVKTILEQIFGEARRVVLNYQKRFNKNVPQTLLSGGAALLSGLSEIAAKSLETEVHLIEPFMKTEAPAFLEEILKEVGPEFAVAVGLALRKLQEYE